MPDREKTIKGLADISEYVLAKADIAGIGKGKEVFDSYYRAVEDAIAMLKEQEEQIEQLENDLAVTQNNLNYYVNGND